MRYTESLIFEYDSFGQIALLRVKDAIEDNRYPVKLLLNKSVS